MDLRYECACVCVFCSSVGLSIEPLERSSHIDSGRLRRVAAAAADSSLTYLSLPDAEALACSYGITAAKRRRASGACLGALSCAHENVQRGL